MSEAAVASSETYAPVHAATAGRLLICMPDASVGVAELQSALADAGIADVQFALPDGDDDAQVHTLPFDAHDGRLLPWFTQPEALRHALAIAKQVQAQACLFTNAGSHVFDAADIVRLAAPLLTRQCAATLPLYAMRPSDGLLSTAVLYPLVRALYGRRSRYPLTAEAGVSVDLLERALGTGTASRDRVVLFSVEAAIANLPLCQVQVSAAPPQAEGRDLPDVLAEIAGAVFSDMEQKAALWQRVRASQPVETLGEPYARDGEASPPDTSRLREQFDLATRNLLEVWGLIMPPTSQVALKRLSTLPATQFHMPDDLWARIVYDFALAHRTRVISRGHLFGAFTPLYLGWIVSFLAQPAESAPARVEAMCRAFESEKPYLLQRWRWPDRFNP